MNFRNITITSLSLILAGSTICATPTENYNFRVLPVAGESRGGWEGG